MAPMLRAATPSCPRRPSPRARAPRASHGSERAIPAAQLTGPSTTAGAERADVTATAPAHPAASAHSPATHPASRTATTESSAIDRAAVVRSANERRRISVGSATAHTTSPITATPRPGRWPTSTVPPSRPTIAQAASARTDAVPGPAAQNARNGAARARGTKEVGAGPGVAAREPPGMGVGPDTGALSSLMWLTLGSTAHSRPGPWWEPRAVHVQECCCS